MRKNGTVNIEGVCRRTIQQTTRLQNNTTNNTSIFDVERVHVRRYKISFFSILVVAIVVVVIIVRG